MKKLKSEELEPKVPADFHKALAAAPLVEALWITFDKTIDAV